MIVVFHQPHLSSRGTSVAMYDYAYYNQTLLGNMSIILYQDNHPDTNPTTESLFKKNFKCIKYSTFNQVDTILFLINCDVIYHIKYGHNDRLLSKYFRNVIHAVFTYSPHGDRYALVSEYLAKLFVNNTSLPNINDDSKTNTNKDTNTSSINIDNYYVPHIVRPWVDPGENYKNVLNIPSDAIVIGRHGGSDTFNIHYVISTIIDYVETHSNYYFLFLGTNKFIDHDRIIFLETDSDLDNKKKFINTCDAMIHARSDGETFGLAIAEFSVANKPVITSRTGFKSHIDLLGDKALIYHDSRSLISIFDDLPRIIKEDVDWNCYRQFEPEKVMAKFKAIFLD